MLGNLSKEQKAMLAADYKEEMIENCNRGQGYFIKDGEGIFRVRVPFITKWDKLHNVLRNALNR